MLEIVKALLSMLHLSKPCDYRLTYGGIFCNLVNLFKERSNATLDKLTCKISRGYLSQCCVADLQDQAQSWRLGEFFFWARH